MDCEELYQGRCKPEFPNMQTLSREQDKKDHKNNNIVQSFKDDIILYLCIETHDSWETKIKSF